MQLLDLVFLETDKFSHCSISLRSVKNDQSVIFVKHGSHKMKLVFFLNIPYLV
jgi:hypothetical protein